MSAPSVIAVIGATGTGKSKLGIQLAKRFNAEVISVDAIQVYQGLDALSNKCTSMEMDGVKHHLISVVEPSKSWDIKDFYCAAEPLVSVF